MEIMISFLQILMEMFQITQFDIFLLFKGHSKEKLKSLYQDMSINIPFEKFYEIYTQVIKEKYNFLYVNQHTCEFRKNFNEEIII